MSFNINSEKGCLQFASVSLLSDAEFMSAFFKQDGGDQGHTLKEVERDQGNTNNNTNIMDLFASGVAQVAPSAIRVGGLRIGGFVSQKTRPNGLRILQTEGNVTIINGRQQ